MCTLRAAEGDREYLDVYRESFRRSKNLLRGEYIMSTQLTTNLEVHKWITVNISETRLSDNITILVHGGATPQTAREATPFNLPKLSILKRRL
jgi:hypothetical protein